MKSIYQTVAISGANLLALTLNVGDATALKPQFAGTPDSGRVQRMSNAQLRTVEASHLEIYAACKWGHATFAPVKVEGEELSHEIQSLHGEMAQA